jgi:hypothetical protein
LADELGSADMDRHVSSAPDEPGSPGRDQGKAVVGEGSPDSSRVSPDSAMRIERSAAYRVAVDVAYRQAATDEGYVRVEKLEREPFIPAMRTEGEDPERRRVALEDRQPGADRQPESAERGNPQVPVDTTEHGGLGCASIGTAAQEVQTGARGPASGREFDPEAAGGPIRQLDARKARITDEGVQEVTAHLQRFTGGGSLQAKEQGMLDRLTSIAAGDMEPTSHDLNFYTHELDEAGRYDQLGFGPESNADLGSSEMYELWNDVHTATLEDYGISDADLFHPGLAP